MNSKSDSDTGLKLKKVAFVAMPFGRKSTGLPAGKGPTQVDCDALWEKAFLPALTALAYLPIRADNQTGSVIVKDMLDQLVHADLVLADISIANGNVYYEAGVRHAARKTGCILLRASWSRPLFDLAQIAQLKYPFPSAEPKDADYAEIAQVLERKIPALAPSIGPVYELTQIDTRAERDSRRLKEVSHEVFEFQNQLAAAVLAASGDKSKLRGLTDPDLIRRLPRYALRDLTAAVRDHLTWGELTMLIAALPDNAFEDPFFREQQAHARGKQGQTMDAVALLETVIEKHGATPERCADLGIHYRELALVERNKAAKRRHSGKAIDAFRRGMEIDLNEYRCGLKLLVALVERDRDSDRAMASRCAMVARCAVDRAAALNSEEESIDLARVVLAFFERNASVARERIDAILDCDWTNRGLVELVQDLATLMPAKDHPERATFEEMVKELTQSLPVAQSVLMDVVLGLIREASRKYRKCQQIHARPAEPNEVIVSTTSDGEETTKTAAEGDHVVKNLTEAQELYLVGEDKFTARYTYVEDVDASWKLYDPVGEVLGIEITRELTSTLGVGEEFFIMAPWGSEQLAREGDMFVSPLPGLDEVYRVARKEFDETYRLVSADSPSA